MLAFIKHNDCRHIARYALKLFLYMAGGVDRLQLVHARRLNACPCVLRRRHVAAGRCAAHLPRHFPDVVAAGVGRCPRAFPDFIPHCIEYALLAFFFIQMFPAPSRLADPGRRLAAAGPAGPARRMAPAGGPGQGVFAARSALGYAGQRGRHGCLPGDCPERDRMSVIRECCECTLTRKKKKASFSSESRITESRITNHELRIRICT